MFRLEGGSAPIYVRLMNAIQDAIKRGDLAPGEKLPTVRQLSATLGVAGGTIRHAYDQLARDGWLTMSQGKGTFACYPQDGILSRERRAMAAISTLLDELERLNFSAREMRMFFELKLNERAPSKLLLQVAVVDCNPEALSEITNQLSVLAGIELAEFLLEDARRMPLDVFARYPLIVTTQTHYHELRRLMGDRAASVARVALSPGQQTVIAIARIDPGEGVGIFCRSSRYAEIIRNAMRVFPHLRQSAAAHLCAGTDAPLSAFLQDKRVLLVSPEYPRYASAEDQQALHTFTQAGGLMIPYHYQIDQGSFLGIEERVKEITESIRG